MTGVPRGASRSIASCTRVPRRSAKLSRSCETAKPSTGTRRPRERRREKSETSGRAAGFKSGGGANARGSMRWSVLSPGIGDGEGHANSPAGGVGHEAATSGFEGGASDGAAGGVVTREGDSGDGIAEFAVRGGAAASRPVQAMAAATPATKPTTNTSRAFTAALPRAHSWRSVLQHRGHPGTHHVRELHHVPVRQTDASV